MSENQIAKGQMWMHRGTCEKRYVLWVGEKKIVELSECLNDAVPGKKLIIPKNTLLNYWELISISSGEMVTEKYLKSPPIPGYGEMVTEKYLKLPAIPGFNISLPELPPPTGELQHYDTVCLDERCELHPHKEGWHWEQTVCHWVQWDKLIPRIPLRERAVLGPLADKPQDLLTPPADSSRLPDAIQSAVDRLEVDRGCLSLGGAKLMRELVSRVRDHARSTLDLAAQGRMREAQGADALMLSRAVLGVVYAVFATANRKVTEQQEDDLLSWIANISQGIGGLVSAGRVEAR